MNPDKMSDGERHDVNVVPGSVRPNLEPLRDMLLWLKSVAIDLSKATTSLASRESYARNLSVRKVLYLNNDQAPWRKRTFSLLQEAVNAATSPPLKKSNGESSRKKGKSSVASHSKGRNGKIQNPHSSVRTIVDNLSQKRIPSGHSSQSVLGTDHKVLLVLDSDDSANGSNPSRVKKPLVRSSQNRPIKLLKSGNNDPRKQLRVRPYPNNRVKGSNSSSSSKAKKSKTQSHPEEPYMFIGDFPQMAVPVGPRFQAVIPDVSPNMEGSSSINGRSDGSEKWLGTRIWPTEGTIPNFSMELIGKGRPKSCLCVIPGSPKCVRYHVNSEKLQLQIDLKTAYYSWEFHKMGEDVAKSWTREEKKAFKMLVKENPLSEEMSFWEPALTCFPSKSRRSIVSYYFNVFVLRRMKMQTRLAKVVDSDNDEFDDEGASQSKEDHFLVTKHKYLTAPR